MLVAEEGLEPTINDFKGRRTTLCYSALIKEVVMKDSNDRPVIQRIFFNADGSPNVIGIIAGLISLAFISAICSFFT